MAEAEHFVRTLRDVKMRETYARLSTAAAVGNLGEELLAPLGGMLEVGLNSGRIRARYGAHQEMAAAGLFRSTPQGKAFHQKFEQASRHLSNLKGLTLRRVSLSARCPGIYTLELETEEFLLSAVLDHGGLTVRSLETSL